MRIVHAYHCPQCLAFRWPGCRQVLERQGSMQSSTPATELESAKCGIPPLDIGIPLFRSYRRFPMGKVVEVVSATVPSSLDLSERYRLNYSLLLGKQSMISLR